MGNNAIILVLGLAVLFSIVNSSLNKSDVRSAENSYGYVKFTAARDIARSAINLALKKFETDSVMPLPVSGNLDNGTYYVDGTAIADTLRMVSTGRFMDTVYTIRTTLWRYPKPFPGTDAAVTLNIDSVNFRMRGTPLIDGRNYDSSGTIIVDSTGVPGVAVLTPNDSMTVFTGSDSGANIEGSQDIIVDSSLADPRLFADEYIAMADYRFDYDPTKSLTVFSGNQVWGTATAPKITFVNAGDSLHAVKFAGTVEGWGVLVVKGNVFWGGTFTFHGLVLVYGDAVLDFSLAKGTPTIIGSMIMGGPAHSSFEMRGTAKVLYSSDALDDAKYIGKLLAYRIVDWYE